MSRRAANCISHCGKDRKLQHLLSTFYNKQHLHSQLQTVSQSLKPTQHQADAILVSVLYRATIFTARKSYLHFLKWRENNPHGEEQAL